MTIALVAAAMRLAIVLAPPAELSPEGWRVVDGVVVEEGRVAFEELLRGSATRDFIEGPVLPYLQDYQVQPFWGGTLVVSMMAVPFFAVLGPTLVALRLTTVVFAVLAALAAFAILERCAGRRAAWIGGLSLAIAPPGVAVFGAAAYGAEVESQALALLTLAAFLAWVDGGLRPARGVLVGVLAGFSIYFGYVVLPLLALLVVYALWLEPGLVRRRATLWPIVGLLVGSLPWTYYNLTHAGLGLRLYGLCFTDLLIEPSTLARRLPELALALVWRDLPGAVYLPEPLRFPLGRLVIAVLALLALAAGVRHRSSLAQALRPPWRRARAPAQAGGAIARVHPTVLFLAFLPVYACAFLATEFTIDHELGRAFAYRYMVPFFPFLLLLAAIGLDALARRSPGARRAANGVAAALCGLFLVANLGYCRFDRVRESWSTPGTSDAHFARSIPLRYGDDLAALTHVVDAVSRKRSAEQQQRFFFVVAQNYKYFLLPTTKVTAYRGARIPDYERALEHLHGIVPEPYAAFFEPLAPGERFYPRGQIEPWRAARASRMQHTAGRGE